MHRSSSLSTLPFVRFQNVVEVPNIPSKCFPLVEMSSHGGQTAVAFAQFMQDEMEGQQSYTRSTISDLTLTLPGPSAGVGGSLTVTVA